MSLHYSIGRTALMLCCLALAGCKGLPFSPESDDSGPLAPDFGLNSVPRQWEPDLEDGDTSALEEQRPPMAFDVDDEDDLRAVKKTRPEGKNLLQKYLSTRGEKGERKTLPQGEAAKSADLDDDFNR